MKAPTQHVESSFEIIFNENELHTETNHGQLNCTQLQFPFARSSVSTVHIKRGNVLYAREDDDKEIFECIFDASKLSDWRYEPGDTIGILPRNTEHEITLLLQKMQLEDKSDCCCHLEVAASCVKKNMKVPQYIPARTTPRQILRDCLNIRAVLKKQFLRNLANCCTNNEDRNFLLRLSAKEGSQSYDELILHEGKTLLDILQLCGSCVPSLSMLIEHLPRLLPRSYSIANSALAHPYELKIIFSILKRRTGITTNMLRQLSTRSIGSIEAYKIAVYLRNINKFRFTTTEAMENNQILISIGTGLSPFLGFLEHKSCLVKDTAELGETWLFVGARNENALLHRDSLLKWRNQCVLNKFFECFSREADALYHYVQELLIANALEFVQFLLLPHTLLYICADGAHISKSIEAAIIECLQEQLKIDKHAASDLIKEFRENGKYREDVWL